ncbi:MAG: ABC transporter permease [Chloroflexi bacterium]|nr:ABC transporter permease [Chloroflexota bacterium]
MTVPLARRNLFAEKGRFAISVAGVAFAVLLILIVLALYRGFNRTGQTFRDLPGELWVVQRGTSDPFHSISLVERERLDPVASMPGVQAVVPVLARSMNFDAGGTEVSARLMALDVPADVVSDELRERYLPPEGAVIIDDTLRRKTGLTTGDTAQFGTESLKIERVRPRSPEVLFQFVFVNFADARRIFGVGDVVMYGMVILEPGADAQTVAGAITDRDPALQVYTKEAFAASIAKEMDETFLPVISILVAIGFIVGAAVVGLTIYTATIERTREFGVMKAVGGSGGYLYRIVLSQAAILTGAGFVVGAVGAWGVARLAIEAVPEFATEFQLTDLAGVFVAAILMAVLASFMPVRRINSIDPAIVFRA